MANITFVAQVETFFQREVPPFSKLNAQITSKINTINDNVNLINVGIETLLQGVAGGAEQANIPFIMASAPTGWTRDVTQSPDAVLRVTDGVTPPPGASPTAAGGQQGGNWQITGSSAAANSAHAHSLQLHSHVIGGHTHTVGAHAHNDGHSHEQGTHGHNITGSGSQNLGNASQSGLGNVNVTPQDTSVAKQSHGHTLSGHNHIGPGGDGGGTTGESSIGTTNNNSNGILDTHGGSTGTGPGNTSNDGSHIHTVNHSNTWRPKYLNILMCTKD